MSKRAQKEQSSPKLHAARELQPIGLSNSYKGLFIEGEEPVEPQKSASTELVEGKSSSPVTSSPSSSRASPASSPRSVLSTGSDSVSEFLKAHQITESGPKEANKLLEISAELEKLSKLDRDSAVVEGILYLRNYLDSMLEEYDIKIQKDEFNFWLLERLTMQRTEIPIPIAIFPYTSKSLVWKIESLFPHKIAFNQESSRFRASLRVYYEKMKELFPELKLELDQQYYTMFERVQFNIDVVKRVVASHRSLISSKFKSKFAQISIDLLFVSNKIAQVAEKAKREEPQLFLAEALTPNSLKLGSQTIRKEAYDELLKRYSGSSEHFNWYLKRVLSYYAAFTGGEYGLQGSLPISTFNFLKEAGVTCECFASSLNSYFGKFLSAFPEVDAPFGAIGEFFTHNFSEGFYEVNPPFTYEVVEPMMEKIIESLCESSGPLSFIIFLPPWKNCKNLAYVMQAQDLVEMNVFKTGECQLPAQGHKYLSGSQHLSDVEYVAIHPTYCCVLQNSAGKAKWPINKEFMDKLAATF